MFGFPPASGLSRSRARFCCLQIAHVCRNGAPVFPRWMLQHPLLFRAATALSGPLGVGTGFIGRRERRALGVLAASANPDAYEFVRSSLY